MSEPSVIRREIEAALEPLFERAEREGLWFYSLYQGLWFSPKELRAEQAKGRFWWGAVNWELRDPAEEVVRLKANRDKQWAELQKFEARIHAS